ncbi:MAG: PDDEXK nuclease domain-containing protein [Cyanobacteria bacterium J06650_10]
MSNQPPLIPSNAYALFLSSLKERIQTAQTKAALAVNQELTLLYWQIGTEILQRQNAEGWGSKVIGRLAKDLKRDFPELKGFSSRNIKYMRSFAEAWPDEEFVHQLGAQIPWKHNCVLIEKVKDSEARRWYIEQTIQNGWSRNILTMQIESNLYQRQGGAITNFERTLPQPQSDLAQQLIKDPYNFDFLTLRRGALERELEAGLVNHIRDFLLELGVGFAFLGSQYPITVDEKEYRIDLLFYHTRLRCYVVIDLKMTEFEPEYAGKMNFYVAAIDDMLRRGDDQPTIGIVLCKTKRKTTAEYALRNVNTPIAISTHRLPEELQEQLPSIRQLEMEIEAATQELDARVEAIETPDES